MTLTVRLDRERGVWVFSTGGSEFWAHRIVRWVLGRHPVVSRLVWPGGRVEAPDYHTMMDAVDALFERCDSLRVQVFDHMESETPFEALN